MWQHADEQKGYKCKMNEAYKKCKSYVCHTCTWFNITHGTAEYSGGIHVSFFQKCFLLFAYFIIFSSFSCEENVFWITKNNGAYKKSIFPCFTLEPCSQVSLSLYLAFLFVKLPRSEFMNNVDKSAYCSNGIVPTP